jgi:hypothetical protein
LHGKIHASLAGLSELRCVYFSPYS